MLAVTVHFSQFRDATDIAFTTTQMHDTQHNQRVAYVHNGIFTEPISFKSWDENVRYTCRINDVRRAISMRNQYIYSRRPGNQYDTGAYSMELPGRTRPLQTSGRRCSSSRVPRANSSSRSSGACTCAATASVSRASTGPASIALTVNATLTPVSATPS